MTSSLIIMMASLIMIVSLIMTSSLIIMMASLIRCTARFERKLLAAMRSVGPYFDTHPEKHLMTRHKCPYIGEQAWSIGAGEDVYTTLWRHPKIRYVCLETDAEPPPGTF